MSKTILIVDDYDAVRSMMKEYLEDFGYRILEAANGIDAVQRVVDELPQLVLMDISMPQLDGISAVRKIKALIELPDIPIICLSAHGELYRSEALAAGCVELLGKPINFDDLDRAVERHLRVRVI